MLLPLAFIGAALARIEVQFQALPGLQYPRFSVQYADAPAELPSGEVITFHDPDGVFSCVIPPEIDTAPPVLPAIEDSSLQMARNVLTTSLKDTVFLVMDEVWYWTIDFRRYVKQLLTEYVDLEPDFSHCSFRTVVGRPGNEWGQSLDTAEPVVVDDMYMLKVEYPMGETCGLTGELRRTKLFFHCNPEILDSVSVQAIDEPYACVYEFLVGVPGLCEIPDFVKLDATNDIQCFKVSGEIPQEAASEPCEQSEQDESDITDFGFKPFVEEVESKPFAGGVEEIGLEAGPEVEPEESEPSGENKLLHEEL